MRMVAKQVHLLGRTGVTDVTRHVSRHQQRGPCTGPQQGTFPVEESRDCPPRVSLFDVRRGAVAACLGLAWYPIFFLVFGIWYLIFGIWYVVFFVSSYDVRI